jgi:hypothetical protein
MLTASKHGEIDYSNAYLWLQDMDEYQRRYPYEFEREWFDSITTQARLVLYNKNLSLKRAVSSSGVVAGICFVSTDGVESGSLLTRSLNLSNIFNYTSKFSDMNEASVRQLVRLAVTPILSDAFSQVLFDATVKACVDRDGVNMFAAVITSKTEPSNFAKHAPFYIMLINQVQKIYQDLTKMQQELTNMGGPATQKPSFTSNTGSLRETWLAICDFLNLPYLKMLTNLYKNNPPVWVQKVLRDSRQLKRSVGFSPRPPQDLAAVKILYYEELLQILRLDLDKKAQSNDVWSRDNPTHRALDTSGKYGSVSRAMKPVAPSNLNYLSDYPMLAALRGDAEDWRGCLSSAPVADMRRVGSDELSPSSCQRDKYGNYVDGVCWTAEDNSEYQLMQAMAQGEHVLRPVVTGPNQAVWVDDQKKLAKYCVRGILDLPCPPKPRPGGEPTKKCTKSHDYSNHPEMEEICLILKARFEQEIEWRGPRLASINKHLASYGGSRSGAKSAVNKRQFANLMPGVMGSSIQSREREARYDHEASGSSWRRDLDEQSRLDCLELSEAPDLRSSSSDDDDIRDDNRSGLVERDGGPK